VPELRVVQAGDVIGSHVRVDLRLDGRWLVEVLARSPAGSPARYPTSAGALALSSR
jgi:hypothetical protein